MFMYHNQTEEQISNTLYLSHELLQMIILFIAIFIKMSIRVTSDWIIYNMFAM